MNILTFDIEEWFHILENDSTKTAKQWARYPCRIHANVERILDILDHQNTRATFFCLGWIAETYPEVVRQIAQCGHEIGAHSTYHQLTYELSPDEFSIDLDRSVKTLQDITGLPVKYYRVPGFSIREDTPWAFDILAQYGIEVDCSVFPMLRGHGGLRSYSQPGPSIIRCSGIELKELPVSYTTILGRRIVFSGGGYFRLCPYPLIRRWTRKSDYVMSYFHPRDFDPEQPVIKELPFTRKFKSYVGLKRCKRKLEQWLSDFDFVDVGTAVERIDWENCGEQGAAKGLE